MEQKSISQAIKQICDEKGISYEQVLETIEAAMAAAYRKDFGNKMQNLTVNFDPDTGKIRVFDVKTVVEDMPEEPEQEEGQDDVQHEGKQKPHDTDTDTDHSDGSKGDKEDKGEKKEDKGEKQETTAKKIEEKSEKQDEIEGQEEEKKKFNPKTEIQLSDARAMKKSHKVGDVITTELEVPGDFGRMAAQTAKQVITQKLREAERETLYNEFKTKEGEILIGTIQRREGSVVLIDLGRITAILPADEQIPQENYYPGDHLKVYMMSVTKTTKGPELLVSRAHPNIVKKLFATEIPEISAGTVEIKGIAREAGARTKISVYTEEENIDPIGSCIGQRGSRVQTIISELRGEKIDIIEYSDNPVDYIINALSPAKINDIKINDKERIATAVVSEDQLSLAIGRAGQNVRLAARLTGWKIDIVSDKGEAEEEAKAEEEETKEKKSEEPVDNDESGSGESDSKKTEKQEEKKESDKKDKNEKNSKKESSKE